MKKLFTGGKTVGVVIVLVLTLLWASLSAGAEVKITKQPDPAPAGDAYGAYYDEAKAKTKERSAVIDSEKTALTYVRTENLREVPASERADHYGTYDIYVDEKQTEYLYLLDTDVCCGFKMSEVGTATPQQEAVSQEKAMAIANEFLETTRSNSEAYELLSCVYNELGGYYDIKFYFPVSGYKSDDIFRLWVNAQGEITSFSEFNYKRYDNLTITAEQRLEAARQINKIRSNDAQKISVVDTYISINDSGEVVLVEVVDITILDGEDSITLREMYEQPIKGADEG